MTTLVKKSWDVGVVAVMVVMVVVVVMMMTCGVGSAPCCGPKQWAGEVRRVTMDTGTQDGGADSSDGTTTQEWHWVSYDLDLQKVAIITFDPRPGRSDLYRRELLDYKKGMHYVTPDEVKCTASHLTGTMPRQCVPPPGGNITLDIRKFFGVFPDPAGAHAAHRRDDSMGMYAETIYYETDDVVGYVTVTSLHCTFVNEMTYTTGDDGSLVWQHTQWNNLTLTVDTDNFNMPKACFNTTTTTPHATQSTQKHSRILGQTDLIFNLD